VTLALFALLLLARLILLDADPPADVHYHFLTDEGWWSHNAKLRAVFGRWVMDEHNVPLLNAPFYQGALAACYALLGNGVVQTRLLAALSGLGVCALVWASVRRSRDARTARLALLFCGAGYFMLTNNRVGFAESFQLLPLTAALLALVPARERLPWAAAGGVAFAASVLAKVSAAPLVLVPLVWWGLELVRERGAPSEGLVRWLGAPLAFGLSGLAVAATVTLALVLPNWEIVRAGLLETAGAVGGGNPLGNIGSLGLDVPVYGERLAPTGFVRQTPLLLALVTLALVWRLGAPAARAPRARAPDPLARLAVCWLGVGAASIAVQDFQPDRRYLILVPPLAILAAIALARGEVGLPARAALEGAQGRWRRLALGALAGLFAGIYLRHWLIPPLQALAGAIPVGDRPGVEPGGAALLAWLLLAAVGSALGPLLARALPRELLRLPTALALALFLVLNLGRFGVGLFAAEYTLRDAGLRVAALAADWPAERRVAVGDLADSLTLGAPFLPVVIRRWEHPPMYMNLDGWERFRPWIAIDEEPPASESFERLDDLEIWRRPNGEPFLQVPLWVRRAPGS
jgi:4-amino-4-deoxy-L-arabinose transferase-like glycosyltransferase